MSRKERFSRSASADRRKKAALATPDIGGESGDGEVLPPRRKKFPSSTQKVTKWFYNALFFIFVILVVALFWYGRNFSE